MATKVFLFSPGGSLETVVEGVGAAIQSSYVVALTVNTATNVISDNGTTRQALKSEVQQAIRILEEYIIRDTGSDWG
jgi:hypothetical protein